MNILLGFDLVECARFTSWTTFSEKQLLKIFSSEEIAYCHQEPLHAASRFAVRFAAREAAYKALQPLQRQPIPFLLFCKAVTIAHEHRVPKLVYQKSILEPYYTLDTLISCSLSLTHTSHTAGAAVVFLAR